jgi:hypothetical protein
MKSITAKVHMFTFLTVLLAITAADAAAHANRRSMRSRPPRPVAGGTGFILAEAYYQQHGRFTTRVAVEGLASMQVSAVAGSWQ